MDSEIKVYNFDYNSEAYVTYRAHNLQLASTTLLNMSLILRKPVFGVSDQVRHKSGCTATEDG